MSGCIMQRLSLLSPGVAAGQTSVLRVGFASSVDEMWASDSLNVILPPLGGVLTCCHRLMKGSWRVGPRFDL